MRSSCLGRQKSWVPIEKCESEISIKKASALAWASIVHKVQGLNLEHVVIDFDLPKQKLFGPGQMYTALSRVKTYDL